VKDAFVKRLLGNLAIAIKSFTNPLTRCYIFDLSPSRHSSCSISVFLPFIPRRIRRFRSGKLLCVRALHFHSSRRCPAPQYTRILRLSQPLQPFPLAYNLPSSCKKNVKLFASKRKSSLECCSLPSSAHCAWEVRSESPEWCYIPPFYQISRKWGWRRSGHARRTDTIPFVPDRHRYAHLHPHKTWSWIFCQPRLFLIARAVSESTPQFGRSD
jgi:hypothetical protein